MKNLIINLSLLPEDLTLNQIYILFNHKNNLVHKADPLDLEYLQVSKYIKITDYQEFTFELRQKGNDLNIDEIIYLKDEMNNSKDDGLAFLVTEFRKLFKATGMSGKTADIKTTTKKMQWFLKEYPEYDKELILKATQKYIDQEAHSGFKYLQRCDYFISKEDTSKLKTSRLASYCEEIDEDYEKESDYGSFTKLL